MNVLPKLSDQLPVFKFDFDLPYSVVVLAQFSSAVRDCCQYFKSAHIFLSIKVSDSAVAMALCYQISVITLVTTVE